MRDWGVGIVLGREGEGEGEGGVVGWFGEGSATEVVCLWDGPVVEEASRFLEASRVFLEASSGVLGASSGFL